MDDEFEALGAGDWVRADDFIAVLEVPCGGAPDEHGDWLAVFSYELAEAISGFASCSELVLFVEYLMGEFPVGGISGNADF